MSNTSKGTGLSREVFLQNLFDSGLFSRDDLSDSVAGVVNDASLADGDALAQRLEEAGKLTAYQTDSVRQRKFTELLIGNYEVLERLGAGGMGTVYKARHRRMKRIVALKVLSQSASQSATFLQRFQREVEVIARLSHPNIVMAFDADEADVGHFLVMEFVNGRDLASEVETAGPLPVAAAIDAILQAARALEYAHAQGIVHRDIKPANLLRDAGGVVKVADLGLARVHESLTAGTNTSLTQAGTVVGTVDFMSPEQAFDPAHLDHRSDIYSLGCTLYFLLTGQPPYQGETFMGILYQHAGAAIPSLGSLRPEVPAALEAVFRKMVAKKPEERYQSMSEVVHALERLPPAPTVTPASPRPAAAASSAAHTAEFKPAQSTLSQASPSPEATTVVITGPASGGERAEAQGSAILLVEPSRTQANIIRNLLTQLGSVNVLVVPSAQKALEALHQARPQTVLCTMHLSDITGVELCRKMRAESPLADIPFVLISSEPDALEAGGLGGDRRTVLLPKPFDLDRLAQALNRAAASGAAGPSLSPGKGQR